MATETLTFDPGAVQSMLRLQGALQGLAGQAKALDAGGLNGSLGSLNKAAGVATATVGKLVPQLKDFNDQLDRMSKAMSSLQQDSAPGRRGGNTAQRDTARRGPSGTVGPVRAEPVGASRAPATAARASTAAAAFTIARADITITSGSIGGGSGGGAQAGPGRDWWDWTSSIAQTTGGIAETMMGLSNAWGAIRGKQGGCCCGGGGGGRPPMPPGLPAPPTGPTTPPAPRARDARGRFVPTAPAAPAAPRTPRAPRVRDARGRFVSEAGAAAADAAAVAPKGRLAGFASRALGTGRRTLGRIGGVVARNPKKSALLMAGALMVGSMIRPTELHGQDSEGGESAEGQSPEEASAGGGLLREAGGMAASMAGMHAVGMMGRGIRSSAVGRGVGGAVRGMGGMLGGLAGRLGGGRVGGMLGGLMGRMGGGLMGRAGGGALGMLAKGAKLLNPMTLVGSLVAGAASTMAVEAMASRGVEIPEAGGIASAVGMLTGLDPRLLQMGIDWLTNTVPGLLSGAWEAIKGVVGGWAASFGSFMEGVANVAKVVWGALVNYYTVFLPGLFMQAWEVLKGVFSALGEGLGAVVRGVVDAVKFVFDGLVNYYTVFLPGMFMTGVELIKGVFQRLADFFTTDLPAAFDWLMQKARDLGTQLTGWATSAVEGVKNGWQALSGFFTETVPGWFGGLLGRLSGFKDSAVEIAGNVASGMIAGLRRIGDFLLRDLPAMVMNGGRAIMRALGDGIRAAGAQMGPVAEDIANRIANFFVGHSPPPEGPLSYVVEGAHNTMAAYAQGLRSATPMLVNTSRDLAGAVWAGLGQSQGKSAKGGWGMEPADGMAAKAAKSGSAAKGIFPVASVDSPGRGFLGGALGAAGSAISGAAGGVGRFLGGLPLVGGAFRAAADDFRGKEGQESPLKGIADKFGGLMASLGPLGIVATLLEGVFQGLSPVIESLKEPLRIVGELFGAALAPVLRALFPIFRFVAIASTYVGEFLFRLAAAVLKVGAAILEGIGGFIKAIGKFINKMLPGNPAKGLVKLGEGFQKAGKGMRSVADGFEQGAKQLKDGRKQLQDMEFGETAEAAQEMNAEMRNVPDGFKIALARFEAAAPQAPTPADPGTGTGTGSGEGGGYPAGGGGYGGGGYGGGGGGGGGTGRIGPEAEYSAVVIENVQIVSNDPEAIWRDLQRVMQRDAVRRTGSPVGLAFT